MKSAGDQSSGGTGRVFESGTPAATGLPEEFLKDCLQRGRGDARAPVSRCKLVDAGGRMITAAPQDIDQVAVYLPKDDSMLLERVTLQWNFTERTDLLKVSLRDGAWTVLVKDFRADGSRWYAESGSDDRFKSRAQ